MTLTGGKAKANLGVNKSKHAGFRKQVASEMHCRVQRLLNNTVDTKKIEFPSPGAHGAADGRRHKYEKIINNILK